MKKNLKVISWNINSIRIRLEQLKKIVEELNPDIICLQETKCENDKFPFCLLYTSPSPRDGLLSRMPSSA